jgi:hypothetical protein
MGGPQVKLTKHQFNAAVILGVLAGTALIATIMLAGWVMMHRPVFFWAFVCAGCVCALIIKAAHAYGDIEDWFWRRKRDRIFKRSHPLFHIHSEDLTHD